MGGLNTLCFGEILFDRIDGRDHLGGAPVNVAVHLSRLGARSYLVSSLGMDALGSKARNLLEREGVRTDFIGTDPHRPTGLVNVTLRGGIPEYDIRENSAWDHILPEMGPDRTDKRWDLLYCGSLAQRSPESRETLIHLMESLTYDHLYFDVNLRNSYHSRDIIRRTLKHASILKVSDGELPRIGEMLFRREEGAGPFFRRLIECFDTELMILTKGPEGAEFYFRALPEEVFSVGAGGANAVDTVGAGDSFSAAFLHSFLSGDRLYRAAEKASLLADFVVGRPGALPEMDGEIRRRLGLDLPSEIS